MSWPKRKIYIVDRSLQYRFFAIALFHFVIILFVIMGAIFIPLSLQLNDMSLSWMERNEIASQFLALHTQVWPPTLLALVFITIHWTLFSHKIAGPLYRFRKVFQEVSSGNLLIQATIRKNDCLKNEASSIDDMILALRQKVKDMEAQQQEVRLAYEDIKQAMGDHNSSTINTKIITLGTQIEIAQVLLEQFKTSNEPTTPQETPASGEDYSLTPSPTLVSSSINES